MTKSIEIYNENAIEVPELENIGLEQSIDFEQFSIVSLQQFTSHHDYIQQELQKISDRIDKIIEKNDAYKKENHPNSKQVEEAELEERKNQIREEIRISRELHANLYTNLYQLLIQLTTYVENKCESAKKGWNSFSFFSNKPLYSSGVSESRLEEMELDTAKTVNPSI